MNTCFTCGKEINKKTQGEIMMAHYNIKEKKNEQRFYHYKPNCTGFIKNPK